MVGCWISCWFVGGWVYVIFYFVYRLRSLTEIVCSGRRQKSAPRRSVMVSTLGPYPGCSSAGVTPNLRTGSMTSIYRAYAYSEHDTILLRYIYTEH